QQAEDEVELLEAQLAVKQARLKATLVSLAHAKDGQKRAEALGTRGAISPEELQSARDGVARLEAELLVREAELKEPMVRLQQARRRLARLRDAGAAGPKGAWPQGVFTPATLDFGAVAHGSKVTRKVRLANPTGRPLRILAVRTTSGALSVTDWPREVDAGASTFLTLTLDTSRFTGPKQFQVVVAFDRPEAAEAPLLVRADSRPRAGGAEGAGDAAPQEGRSRLQELDRKLDRLLKEVDELRREMRSRGGRR